MQLRFAIDIDEEVIVSSPHGPADATVAFPIIDYDALPPFSAGVPMPWRIEMLPLTAERRARFRWLTPAEVATIPGRLRAAHAAAWRGEPATFTDADLSD
jgi:hypothetical protein